jgi:hypothetical protein
MSIFKYQTDITKFKHTNECVDYTPPFLTKSLPGLSSKNVQVEDDLRNATRIKTRCQLDTPKLSLTNGCDNKREITEMIKQTVKQCESKILDGYIPK